LHFYNCKKSKLSNDSRQIIEAKKNYAYALMASNSYAYNMNIPEYKINNWKKISRKESDSGLSVEVYESLTGLKEIVVVYEGTNTGSFNDWKFNLALTVPQQFDEALRHLVTLRSENPNVKITTVGHSLGGGLALNMSMLVEDVSAVAFNSSPRAFWGDIDQNNGNSRKHLYETGEVLNAFSRTYLRARLHTNKQLYPVKYNFLDFTNLLKPISEHSMYRISRGLMLLAIKGGSEEAKKDFRSNIPREKALKDWRYCKLIYN
jgi:hypothetical protein